MTKFTEVYKAAAKVVSEQTFAEPDWKKFLETDCGIKGLFGDNGFDTGKATKLDDIRKRIVDKSFFKNSVAIALFGGGPGETIYKASQNKKSTGNWQDRAAVLELVRCLYRASDTGGAGVWVYSPPLAHSKPVFEELQGSDSAIKKKLGSQQEIFTADDRKLMVDALSVARKVVGDTVVALGGKTDNAKKLVKRWFLGDAGTDAEVDTAIGTLLAGFNKISSSCTATTLVFTDYLDWRATRDRYFGAAFRGGEGGKFPVVYLEGAFTRLKGNTGKLWLAAETIIHELSHFDVSTEDHRYDSDGLKPGGNTLSSSQALANADSWGYFALDLAGYLSKSDRTAVLK